MNKFQSIVLPPIFLILGCAQSIEQKCLKMNIDHKNFNGSAIILNSGEVNTNVYTGEMVIENGKYALSSYYNIEENKKIQQVLQKKPNDFLIKVNLNSFGVFSYDKKNSRCFYEIKEIFAINLQNSD